MSLGKAPFGLHVVNISFHIRSIYKLDKCPDQYRSYEQLRGPIQGPIPKIWDLFVQRRQILLQPLLLSGTLSGLTMGTRSPQDGEILSVWIHGGVHDPRPRGRGVKDDATRHKLLQVRELILRKAIDICKASESASQQLRTMTAQEHVKALQPSQTARSRPPTSALSKVSLNRCKYCGGTHEPRRKLCPAYGQTCHRCSKKSHLGSVWLSTLPSINQGFVYLRKPLLTNPYVSLFSLDFTQAFNSVRHHTLWQKLPSLNIPDDIPDDIIPQWPFSCHTLRWSNIPYRLH